MSPFPIQEPLTTSAYYGSLEGVQGYLTMVVITETSKPSIAQVAEAAAQQYRLINARLEAKGCAVPMVDTTGRPLVADAENLLVAASLFERLVIGRNPSPDRVGVAEVWRKQADQLLSPILSGSFNAGPRSGHTTAGVANAPSPFVDEALETFIDTYGEASD